MKYKNQKYCKIRTITTFINLSASRKEWDIEIKKACDFCTNLSEEFNKNEYGVQSIRIVTNAFGEYLNLNSLSEAKNDLEYIKSLLDLYSANEIRIRFAIGEAKTNEELVLLPELIRDYNDLCNACVNISMDENGILDNELINACAIVVNRISKITPRGEGNFNFTVNFNCKEFIPYFPASFKETSSKNSFVIGLETPKLLKRAIKDLGKQYHSSSHNEFYKDASLIMSEALQYHVDKIKVILDSFKQNDFLFAGLDSSAAPSKDTTSIVSLYKNLGVKHFGDSGSIEVSSLLTKVFKNVKNLKLTGFSGLMLAVIEDKGLAKDCTKEKYDIRTLLSNSAVCGIGLDTVPIPGDTSVKKISSLMRDTGTLAFRLDKPLTVRLFPYPNKKAKEMTQYDNADLCNCKILEVP